MSAFDIYEVDTILIGDFDGDGNVDVAGVWSSGPPPDGPAGGGGTQFDVLSGDGTGNFAITYGVYSGGTYFDLIAADVNGDGISDLISPTQLGEPGLTIFYGAPNRAMQFAQIPTERCAPNNFSTTVAVADFNGDQIPDIAFPDSECGGQNATRITILPGKGNNHFGFDVPVFSATSIFPLVYALRGNRDTKADLAFQTSTSTKSATRHPLEHNYRKLPNLRRTEYCCWNRTVQSSLRKHCNLAGQLCRRCGRRQAHPQSRCLGGSQEAVRTVCRCIFQLRFPQRLAAHRRRFAPGERHRLRLG